MVVKESGYRHAKTAGAGAKETLQAPDAPCLTERRLQKLPPFRVLHEFALVSLYSIRIYP
jgi:hypothetical protein